MNGFSQTATAYQCDSSGYLIFLKALHYDTMKPVQIDFEDGRIVAVTEIEERDASHSQWIVTPGLIDNQVNGFAGVDFSGEQLSVEGISGATKALQATGVTTYLPTLITNSTRNLIRNLKILTSSLSEEEVSSVVPGFHLEGPYLSKLEGFKGCHPENDLAIPDTNQFIDFQEAANGKILQITLAPELEGAQDLIRYCTEHRVTTAIGHSNANGREIREACDNGVSLSTHLGNGCANFIHRHNNPIWPQLADDRLIPTVIADGHHLLPEELKVFLKVKGAGRIILTSDITYLAGMPAGRYRFGGADVILNEEGMLKSADLDCLAGATLSLLKGVENMMKFTSSTLGEAINMASVNVAKVFGWNDLGEIVPGRRADLLLLKRDGSQLQLLACIKSGKLTLNQS
jgi:N-acetylglucosamine-6-phosphate deacetylase